MVPLTSSDLDLPGGLDAQGQLASTRTLWVLQQTAFPGRWLDHVAPAAGRAVVLARLQRKTSFEPLQVGGQLLDVAAAQREVEALSPAGEIVADLERREVRIVRQRLEAKASSSTRATHIEPNN